MFLHLGSHISVEISDIIGIFDLDHVSTSRITRDFLKAAEEDGMIVPVGSELPKSLVVCCPKGSWQRVYISPLAPATLRAGWIPSSVPNINPEVTICLK